MRLLVACLVIASLVITGCSSLVPDAGGLPVDPDIASSRVTGGACTHELLSDPLNGTIRIDMAANEPVSFTLEGGEPFSIRWPSGFRLVAEPEPQIIDEVGGLSFADGSQVEFASIARTVALASPARPFTVWGWIGDECYTRYPQ